MSWSRKLVICGAASLLRVQLYVNDAAPLVTQRGGTSPRVLEPPGQKSEKACRLPSQYIPPQEPRLMAWLVEDSVKHHLCVIVKEDFFFI